MSIAAVAVFSALSLPFAGPAAAGGSWFAPVADSYAPGDTVTLVGYTGGGSLGRVEDGPFFGYLRVDPQGVAANPEARAGESHPLDVPVGELVVEDTGRAGSERFRASITFTLPDGLAPGRYEFVYCNTGCASGLGDLVGGYLVVGEAAVHRPVRPGWMLRDDAFVGIGDDAPANVSMRGPAALTGSGETHSADVGTEPAPSAVISPGSAGGDPSDALRVAAGVGAVLLVVGSIGVRRRRSAPAEPRHRRRGGRGGQSHSSCTAESDDDRVLVASRS